MSDFKVFPASEIINDFARLKRRVQLGRLRIVISYYGDVIGFLVPLSDLSPENGIPIENQITMSINEFENKLKKPKTLTNDCIYLTSHTRRIIAFLSKKFTPYMPIPIMEIN